MGGNEAASMFAGQPQPVEIHHRGIWYSGELIGWRHESDGRVAARVRCRVDGLRHSAWMDLADLRLPDAKRPPHKEPFPAVVRRRGLTSDVHENDATRPHLLAGLHTRPAKPVFAVQPPAHSPRLDRSVETLHAETLHAETLHAETMHTETMQAQSIGTEGRESEGRETAAAAEPPQWNEPTPALRRNRQLHKHEAYLTLA